MLKVTSRGERGAQRSSVGRRRGGRAGGTRSKTQEVEKDEGLGDNVMHRGAEPEEEEEEEEECLGEEEERVNEGRVQGVCIWHWEAGEKIAWATLAGRVCLCLIEEGCETETPNWLGRAGTLPRRDGHRHTRLRRTYTLPSIRPVSVGLAQPGDKWQAKRKTTCIKRSSKLKTLITDFQVTKNS